MGACLKPHRQHTVRYKRGKNMQFRRFLAELYLLIPHRFWGAIQNEVIYD